MSSLVEDGNKENHAAVSRGKQRNTKAKKQADSAAFDVSRIELQGEQNDGVEVFDTCDDVRRKINAHLRNTSMTQSALCREAGKMFAHPKSIQSKQLADFLRKRGPLAGNTSSVFYGAYVYFEKLRIKTNAKKSAKRQEMERIYPRGMDTTRLQNSVFCFRGEMPHEDQYGRLSFQEAAQEFLINTTRPIDLSKLLGYLFILK